VDCRLLNSAQVGQVHSGDRLVDDRRQLCRSDDDVGQDRLGVRGRRAGRPPRPAEVGQQNQHLRVHRRLSHPRGWRERDVALDDQVVGGAGVEVFGVSSKRLVGMPPTCPPAHH
jgi:hypothetical protein